MPLIVRRQDRAQARAAARGCWAWSAWRRVKSIIPASFPAASASAWRWRARW